MNADKNGVLCADCVEDHAIEGENRIMRRMVKVADMPRPKCAWWVGSLLFLLFWGILTVPFVVGMMIAAFTVPHIYVMHHFDGGAYWKLSRAFFLAFFCESLAAFPFIIYLSILVERPLIRRRCGPCQACGRLGFDRVFNLNYPIGPLFLRCMHCGSAYMVQEEKWHRLNEEERKRFFGPAYYCRRCKKFSKEEKCEHCGFARTRGRLLDIEKNEYMRQVFKRNPPVLEETAAGG